MFKTTTLAGACALALAGTPARAADTAAPPLPSTFPPNAPLSERRTVAADPPFAPVTVARTAPPSSGSSPSDRPAGPAADAPATPAATGAPAATQLGRVEVTGTGDRLDAARNLLSPETGSSIYRFDAKDIARLPLGDATPLNQVLLRAPGVVGDSYGQLHVRGDHANLQYRINGVVLPEAIGGFGQVLDTRFANDINLLTGALPAQYGYQTAGVIDIRTKASRSGQPNAGSLDLVVGTRGHREGSLQLGGSAGDLEYYVTGSWLQNQVGIENPTPARNAIHDETKQAKGFAYLSLLLGPSTRASLMLGSAVARFQIPNLPGQAPGYALAGSPAPDSSTLDANQRERNDFQIATLQSTLAEGTELQVSVFNRRSTVHYRPDPVGDLVYDGVAADIERGNTATGVQADLSRTLGEQHTLRAGLFAQRERGTVSSRSTVFPADDAGRQTSDSPLTIADASRLSGHLLGAYLQDEWQPTRALTVNAGVRWDQVTTVGNESQWSPRLGVVYDLSAETRIHAGYARYFTPPPTEKIDTTSVARFAGTTNALPSDANTAVVSERSHYLDLGISHQLSSRITVGADAYYRDVRHLQDEGQFGNALIYSAFNFERGRIRGLELTGSYKDDRTTAYLNVSISSALGKGIETGQFNFDPDELAYIQNHWVHLDHDQTLAISTGGSYRLGDGTQLGADLLVASGLRRGFANSDNLPANVELNLSAARGFTFGGFGKVDFRLTALNVLDRSYELRDGSGIGVGAPQYGPRRSLYLAVSKPFTF